MPKASRLALIRQLESHRKRRLVAFVLGDRPGGLETRIAGDSISLMAQLLEQIGKVSGLDLFVYSTGGITMAAYALVNLVREYTSRFSVLVPYKAQSAATLICLGADEVVMTPLATLSPVDPSTNTPFNPLVPNLPPGAFPPQMLPVSVEDVVSYLDLAREEAGLTRQSHLREVFLRLAQDVRPLALGSVHRARTQIRMLSRKLLASHEKGASEREVGKVVDVLTKQLFSHDYSIGRKEARDQIKLAVTYPEPELEQLVMKLYREYETDLSLLDPYNPDAILGNQNSQRFTFERAYIETTAQSFGFVSVKEINRIQVNAPGPGGVQVPTVGFTERVLAEGWRNL